MGDNTALTIVLGFIALVMLIGVVLLGVMLFVIYKYRVPARGIVAMLAALAYFVSPVDALPEVVLGPIGLIDDVGIIGAVGIFVYRMIQARRRIDPFAIDQPNGQNAGTRG